MATLHSVRPQPTDGQREVVARLVAMTAATVVMSRASVDVLTQVYGADPSRITVIPHGIPELPLVDPAPMKLALGVDGRRVILSYGLLSAGKGYASVIAALPGIVAAHPTALYAIVGPTHPERLLTDGETDRDELVAQVARLGLEEHVRFVDKFVGRVEMIRWLEPADVVVTAYPDLDHDVSGILACAMGAGRAVVATPFAYATELLADGRGVLVDAESSASLTREIDRLLGDDERRAAIGQQAYLHSRPMIWSAVGAAYRAVFARFGTPPPRVIQRPVRRLAAVHL